MYNDTIKVANKIISDTDLADIFQRMDEELKENQVIIFTCSNREKEILEKSTQRAAQSVIEVLENGIDVAMNKFN